MFFNYKLDEKRKKKGFRIADLANRAGLATSTISLIINGRKTPTNRTLHKLAEALDCSPSEIFQCFNREGK